LEQHGGYQDYAHIAYYPAQNPLRQRRVRWFVISGPSNRLWRMIVNATHTVGWKARDFTLTGTDDKTYSLAEVRGPKGALVVFICNHCPSVKASINRIVAEANALRGIGIGTIAIMPNDTDAYPEDSFDNMTARYGFAFPYAIDTTQEVARAYDAQCTADFFGFNAQDELQYRGRLDSSRMTPVPNGRRDLFEAMKQIAETGHGPKEQIPSMGCSIKWKR
jgi:peroxiredoxin